MLFRSVSELYTKMLKEFKRVLTRDGRIVVLTGAKEEFEMALDQESAFELVEKFNMLVSGKKAAIYKLILRAV